MHLHKNLDLNYSNNIVNEETGGLSMLILSNRIKLKIAVYPTEKMKTNIIIYLQLPWQPNRKKTKSRQTP